MSFNINWPTFSPEFIHQAKTQITTALNKGSKPANIVGDIVVEELYMGKKVGGVDACTIESLEIGYCSVRISAMWIGEFWSMNTDWIVYREDDAIGDGYVEMDSQNVDEPEYVPFGSSNSFLWDSCGWK